MNIVIICAGGNGERMQSRENKIFLKINGLPIIYYTLKTFSDYRKVDAIIITVGEENIDRVQGIIKKNGIEKVLSIENAYATRQESTFHVIEKLKTEKIPKGSFIIIHNAVNPFVAHSELDQCLSAAQKHGASVLGFPATDTIKIVNEKNLIDHTPRRESVWIAQTPQIIRFDIAIKAFEKAHRAHFTATDDTTLVESIHEEVGFVECSRENFKITFPQDLEFARQIYLRRMKEKNCWYA
jgi:2-C-methyl-D-erythritol 4-phosphate cytidylyltransferase